MQVFVEKITVIDFSYLDYDDGLLGDSLIVDVFISGSLDDQGMIMDFSKIKKDIKNEIDQNIDHKLLVPRDICVINREGDVVNISCVFADQNIIKHSSPEQAVCIIDGEKITTQAIKKYVQNMLKKFAVDGVVNIDVDVYNEEITGSYYRYSHGLRKHDGNCQRIAHGHRSPIKIWKDSERDDLLEKLWAQNFDGIYIGTREDIKSEYTHNGVEMLHFSYEANQGSFSLDIAKSRCYIIEQHSTVENIAKHIASNCTKGVKVMAYEGVNKGAVCLSQ